MTIDNKNKGCNVNKVGKPNSDLLKAFTKTLITPAFKCTQRNVNTHIKG